MHELLHNLNLRCTALDSYNTIFNYIIVNNSRGAARDVMSVWPAGVNYRTAAGLR